MSYALIKSQWQKVNIWKGECRGVEVNLNNKAEVKMKKLSLIVIIAALSMFMSAAVASDFGHSWWDFNPFHDFHGTYEMISSGICLHSKDGWKDASDTLNGTVPPFTPVAGSTVWAGTATARATWIFNKDGTGTVQGTNYASIFPGGDISPYVAQSPFGWAASKPPVEQMGVPAQAVPCLPAKSQRQPAQ